MEELIKLAREFTNLFGPSGFEDDVISRAIDYVGAEHCTVDPINNVYLGLNLVDENKKTILLDCHSDEVGFIVESINPTGTINFLPLGGWYDATLPSSAVNIKSRNGKLIKGVISSKPVHFMTPEERTRPIKMSELVIDIGTSSYEETSQRGIDVGCPIAPDVSFIIDEENGIMRSKAFDDRLGLVASIYLFKKYLKKIGELNFNLVVSISSQEELGLRGAMVASQKINPDFVIAFEASPADDSFRSGNLAKGKLSKGVQLRVIDGSMLSNPRMIEYARSLATKNNIDYQIIARSSGGTNAGKFHLSSKATPSLVLGVPSRYIHTHYSYASSKDLKSMVDLASVIIEDLNEEKYSDFTFKK